MPLRRRNGRLQIDTARLRLHIDLDRLTLGLASGDGRTRIEGARVGLDRDGRAIFARGAEVEAERDLPSTEGVSRIEISSQAESSIQLRLEIDVAERWPGVVLRLSAVNAGPHPVPLRRLIPLSVDRERGGALAFPFDSRALRFLRMGYQSWTPMEYVPLGGRQPRPRLAFVRRMHEGPFTPPPRRGLHVSDFVTTIRSREMPSLTVGFVSHHRFLTHVTLGHGPMEPLSLEASVATEGLELMPGEALYGERLWVGLDPPGTDGLAEWAERTGREMGAPVPSRVGAAWCSWYQFFTRVTAADVERNLEALAPYRGRIETVQIDDGFQAAVGDWLEWDRGFPDGVAPLATRIRDRGFRAGIWLAPFLVSRASNVARKHPEWLLRGAGGRPLVANVNPAWKGLVCYALDPTHPEVLGWLAEVVATLRSSGFDYLKLDFLYAGLLAGRRHDPRQPSGAAYRRGLETLRSAAGPEPFLVGCGAPLGPSVGLVDAMRIGPDVAPKWRSRGEDALAGLPAAPSARNSVRNVLARAPLHQRLWVNDPDCVLLRDRDTRLSEKEVRTVAASALVSGGLLVVSDDLRNLSPDRRDLLARLLPPGGGPVRTGPLEGPIPEVLIRAWPDGSILLLCVNLEEQPRGRHLDLASTGLSGAVHAYDVWADRYLGLLTGPLNLPPIPPHGCALLRLVPAEGGPSVVGSTLHLSGGAAEVASIERRESGGLRVRLAVPGRRSARLWVDPGTRTAIPVPIEIDGTVEVSVPGVQIPDPPADRRGETLAGAVPSPERPHPRESKPEEDP